MFEISGLPFSHNLTQNYGGDTLNTAIYISRIQKNIDVYYVTALGNDPISNHMKAQWEAEGVLTKCVLKDSINNTGLYWIILNEYGERSFVYWRKNSAASQWLKHQFAPNVLEQLLTMDWIYLSGISLAILDQNDRDTLLGWLKKYKKLGGKIAFDSNYRPHLWEDQLSTQENYRSILDLTDLALLTDEDERNIWNLLSDSDWNAHFSQFKCKTVILKQGADDALIFQNSTSIKVPAHKVEQVIDTTAAGDSFNAAVIAGILLDLTCDDACALGHQLASHVIQHKGAIIPHQYMPKIF